MFDGMVFTLSCSHVMVRQSNDVRTHMSAKDVCTAMPVFEDSDLSITTSRGKIVIAREDSEFSSPSGTFSVSYGKITSQNTC